jgi:hypothetical protein
VAPDRRQHRGAHPEDRSLFAPECVPTLRAATAELCWLLTRDYQIKSALKLVGDRHKLTERQRLGIARAACSDASLRHRRETCVPIEQLRGQAVVLDGFNLLITVEAALSGGLLLLCRDDCLRDLSSVHGSYRSVQETERAINLIGGALAQLDAANVHWLLDRPISNSGRLAAKLRAAAGQAGWTWQVELAFNPDALLQASPAIALTSDSIVLDSVARWANLLPHLCTQAQLELWLVDLRV